MKSRLYVLSTPIGNMNDISNHFMNIIESLDYLFCEDTRVTSKLLNLLNIKNKPKLISHHKFNENKNIDKLIKLIKTYQCGLISDAGYPGISDPGYILINACHNNEILVEIINGPSAVNHAIVQSGFSSNGYCFIGFLPNNEKEIEKIIKKYEAVNLPLVFFESVHRINKTIKLLKNILASNSMIYIGRELTKKFEEYYIASIQDIKDDFINKGEFTIVIKFNSDNDIVIDDETMLNKLDNLVKLGMKYKNACKFLADEYNLSVNTIYNKFIKKFNK